MKVVRAWLRVDFVFASEGSGRILVDINLFSSCFIYPVID